MKCRINNLFLILLTLFAFTSCYEENSITPPDSGAGRLIVISGEIDQVNISRVNDEGFCDDDEIGIYIVDYTSSGSAGELANEGNRADNAKFIYDEDTNSWSTTTDFYFKDENTNIDLIGYYPYATNIEQVNDYNFDIQRDQSQSASYGTMGGYEASDFLWGMASDISPTEQIIRITFNHIMASVRVTLIEGDGFEDGEWSAASKDVLITGTARNCDINLATGSVVASADVEATGIVPYKSGDEYRAIVVPQTVAAEIPIISITIDGVVYKYSRTASTTFTGSKLHNFGMTINKKANGEYELELTSESITAWENDNISHDASAKEYIVVDVPTAGTLADCIIATGNDYTLLKSLKVTGEINNTDFEFMCDDMTSLQYLNLKEIEIMAEGNYLADVIPASAFYGKTTLLRLTLPDKLTAIGNSAFSGCSSLTGSLIIPEGVTEIGSQAFYYCSSLMGSLYLPSTLVTIGSRAFTYCGFICNLNLPTGLVEIGSYAFWGCSGFYGNLLLPTGLTIIEQYSFLSCSELTGSLIIPEGVIEIGNRAFMSCGFNGTLTLPSSLEQIDDYAFSGNTLQFKGELTLPENLFRIGSYAFQYCQFSGDLVLPESLAIIGSKAFQYCTRLTGVLSIPESVLSIGSYAFSGCTTLEGIIFNKSIENIATSCFENCYGIGSIVCQNTYPPYVATGAFDGVPKENFTLEVPEASINLYQTATGWSDFKLISAYSNLVISPMKSSAINTSITRDLVIYADDAWEVESCPNWITLDKTNGTGKTELTMTVAEMSKGSENRTGEVVFKLSENDYTTTHTVSQYNYEYAENELITLQSHTVGNGVDVVILGDGFSGEDISNGEYIDVMTDAMEYFFGLPPYSTYRNYFNVYTAIALSSESGTGSVNTIVNTKFSVSNKGGGTLEGDADLIFDYTEDNTPISNLDETLIIMIPNTGDYGGICYMWDEGAAIAYCPISTDSYPYDFRGLVQHEAGGHGFGKLGDEYICLNAYIDNCSCSYCDHEDGINTAHSKGWYQNLSLNGKMDEVPWSEFIFHSTYSSMVDIFEGGYMHTRGVYRSEESSCMNNNIPYYSAVSRREMVKRIMDIAGETYTFDKFVQNDDLNAGSVDSRSYISTSILSSSKNNQHTPQFMGKRRK